MLCGRYRSFRIGTSESNNRRLKTLLSLSLSNYTRGLGLCLAFLFLLPSPYKSPSTYITIFISPQYTQNS